MNSIDSALAGIGAGFRMLEISAHRTANVGNENMDVDLAEEAARQIEADLQIRASVNIIRAQQETAKSLLDILA